MIPATETTHSKWHARDVADIMRELETQDTGLTSREAGERLKRHGPNQLPEPARQSALVRFLLQFHNVLIYVLLASATITAALAHWADSAVILAVVIVNAVIGFIQEGKAQKALDAIRHMLAPHSNVLRDGSRINVPANALVPGDVILLEAGDKVPADIRLVEIHGIYVQEAILTGESVPVEKQTHAVDNAAPVGDRLCMAFSGTLITSGQGRGVVVATGAHTEIGRISHLISTVETLTTPLVEKMGSFSRWLTLLILVVAALLLVHGYVVSQHDFGNIFMAVVGLAVAAIPEGLPAVLTITLAIGVRAMARRNVIVRRLPAIETLGSVSVICTDKTGTLTRNEMMVASVVAHVHRFNVGGEGYVPRGTIKAITPTTAGAAVEAAPPATVITEIAQAAMLCNDAALHESDGTWIAEGDPMEGALLAFAEKAVPGILDTQAGWSRTDVIPFDAKHRFMATLHHDHSQNAVARVKGAPERILAMCAQQKTQDGTESLDMPYWVAMADEIASQGQRVLAFATRSMPSDHTVLEHSDIDSSLVLLGMVGMIDSPRAEAIAAVAQCRSAGIRVKMITGDHALTAAAIAKQVGLQNVNTVLTGADIDRMDDAQLKDAARGCDIFARTSPEHKLRLVMALQSDGMIVAMTGDGVNDAPALKRADAGIAMGQKGSEVAKESAELVLTDDNFVSIVAAVREGRTVYDNLKKVISWTLPTNGGEASTIIVALLFGMSIPITPIQILWVNLITAVTLGVALAFEPTEENTMRRPPRPRSKPLLGGSLVWQIIFVSALFLAGVFGIHNYAILRGDSITLARTLALNTLVGMEMVYLFLVRNIYGTSLKWKVIRGTKIVWAAVATVALAQLAITYIPSLQIVFGTVSVSLADGLRIAGIGLALFIVTEIEKQIRLRLRGRKA